jgi:hypothetical protein
MAGEGTIARKPRKSPLVRKLRKWTTEATNYALPVVR